MCWRHDKLEAKGLGPLGEMGEPAKGLTMIARILDQWKGEQKVSLRVHLYALLPPRPCPLLMDIGIMSPPLAILDSSSEPLLRMGGEHVYELEDGCTERLP